MSTLQAATGELLSVEPAVSDLPGAWVEDPPVEGEEPPVVKGEALTTPASFGPGYCRVRGMPSRT